MHFKLTCLGFLFGKNILCYLTKESKQQQNSSPSTIIQLFPSPSPNLSIFASSSKTISSMFDEVSYPKLSLSLL